MCFLFLNWAYLYIQQLLFINANGIAMKSLLSFCITRGLLKSFVHPGVLPSQLHHSDRIGLVSVEGALSLSLHRPRPWSPVTFSGLGDLVDSENFLLWNVWPSLYSWNLRRWGMWTWIQPAFFSSKVNALSHSTSIAVSLSESLRELQVLSTDRWFLGVRDLMLPKADWILDSKVLTF